MSSEYGPFQKTLDDWLEEAEKKYEEIKRDMSEILKALEDLEDD